MGLVTIPNRPPGTGVPRSIAQILANFDAITSELNGNLDDANIKVGAGINPAKLGGGLTFFKYKEIATEEFRTNVAYATLTTPDEITGVVVPAGGLIVCGYQAMWKETVTNDARAAIFLGANQVKVAANVAAPIVQEAQVGANAPNIYRPLSTNSAGMQSNWGSFAIAYTGDVTTGQAMGTVEAAGVTGDDGGGGFASFFAAAATYTVSVQFKAASGTVTAKNRKLWVGVLSPQA